MSAHQAVRDDLKKFGPEISYDWTLHGSVKSVSKERLREVASLELNGVSEADLLLFFFLGDMELIWNLGLQSQKKRKSFFIAETL